MDILQGIKVIDVTAWAFVPSAGGVMGHWGADVIKVESPSAPDPMRLLNGTLEPGGSSNTFKHYSRAKRSIAIDLATPEGQELLYDLAKDADVFLTSYLPATRRKLKIDVEDIRKVNPNIVYARGSGYGPKGPEAERPGYDAISWWYRGSLGQSAMDQSGSTWPTGMVGHGDGMSGVAFAGGICAALLKRERTGETSVVDGSLMGTAVWFNGLALIAAQVSPTQREFVPAKRPVTAASAMSSATMSLYQTKDNRFLNLLFLGDADRDYVDLCQHIDRPELATDPRFAHAAERVANSAELMAIFEEVFAAKTIEEWKTVLVTARGAWAPIQTPEELLDDPQTLANGFLRQVDYPDGGVKLPVPPVLFDEEAGDVPAAPDFGEHTDEILRELGRTAEDIGRLRGSGIVV
jgi:crotonobetainyl-CoA:carnitine CoA-transferase CaiB-like acyl-CoA transferase